MDPVALALDTRNEAAVAEALSASAAGPTRMAGGNRMRRRSEQRTDAQADAVIGAQVELVDPQDPLRSAGERFDALVRRMPDLRVVRMPGGPEGYRHADPGELVSALPCFISWQDYTTRTTLVERRAWCARKAKTANRPRLMSGLPDARLTPDDVLAVLERAEGRCVGCRSLAVEPRPSRPNGAPAPWAPVGRRIGSLGHEIARFDGGSNERDNLVWSCLWCNTWPSERRPGAVDHGGIQGGRRRPHDAGR